MVYVLWLLLPTIVFALSKSKTSHPCLDSIQSARKVLREVKHLVDPEGPNVRDKYVNEMANSFDKAKEIHDEINAYFNRRSVGGKAECISVADQLTTELPQLMALLKKLIRLHENNDGTVADELWNAYYKLSRANSLLGGQVPSPGVKVIKSQQCFSAVESLKKALEQLKNTSVQEEKKLIAEGCDDPLKLIDSRLLQLSKITDLVRRIQTRSGDDDLAKYACKKNLSKILRILRKIENIFKKSNYDTDRENEDKCIGVIEPLFTSVSNELQAP
ncbi:unnamed protein product [Thelazia callipaeda]|uniref:Secreted protein n=1 Tax=Thelazia callipaeda TaxID=103827 RepID=A0A0N5D8R6_THECL|nr:unnamed protein product [Thelazia callipaeda]